MNSIAALFRKLSVVLVVSFLVSCKKKPLFNKCRSDGILMGRITVLGTHTQKLKREDMILATFEAGLCQVVMV